MGLLKAVRKAWAVLALVMLASGPAVFGTPAEERPAEDSSALELPEATAKVKRKEAAREELKTDYLGKIPNTLNDPVRAVSFLPGVTVQNDVNIRPFVRGGDAEETQVIMNGIPLLQPYHVGGVFSVFNSGTLESVELYREDFPVEDPGALSGIMRLKMRRPSGSKPSLKANLSMLRGDAFAEVPVVKDAASVYAGAQAFLFGRSMHGLLDLSSKFSDDSLYQQDIQGYRDHINLPEFHDFHWGASFFGSPSVHGGYSGSLSTDDYAVVVPKQLSIIKPAGPSQNSTNTIPVVPIVPKQEIARSKKLSVDSVSAVGLQSQTHFLDVSWDAGPRTLLESRLGVQAQDWDVGFKKEAAGDENLRMEHSARLFSYQTQGAYTSSEGNAFKAGFGYDFKRQRYDVEIPYVLYDVIINGNMDMLETLGNFSGNGFTIPKEDSARSNFDYLGEYPSRIRFSHQGELEEHFGSVFLAHTFKVESGSVSYGIRGEYQSTSGEFFPSPRASYKWIVDGKNEILYMAGLYSQNNLPFYERDLAPDLRSEKSGHAGVRWSHRFAEGYRLTFDSYYKRYYDLVAPSLKPNGDIRRGILLVPRPGSGLSEDGVRELKSILDTVVKFPSLPDSIKDLAYDTFGDLVFEYANTGIGNSLGSEISFFYNPNSLWTGWLSLDASLSNRQDNVGLSSYDYRYHRPLVFNWVNYFDMPGNYEIGFTYRWAMGQAYTPYSGTMDGMGSTEPIQVGPRNSGRLAPYSRLDIRLARNVRWLGGGFKAYVEVWNSMNAPNYFARDNRTGQLKSAQLNFPFPLFFLGASAEL